jgi:predicted  nucleic acid-binding Zn-ribbon protein
MEHGSKNDQLYGQPDEVEGQNIVGNGTSLQDMLRYMFEKLSEDNQNLRKDMSEMRESSHNLEKKLSDVQVNLERKISENNKELKNYVSEVRAEMKADNERLAKKFEMENQNLQKKCSEKIEFERTRFTNAALKKCNYRGTVIIARSRIKASHGV